MERGPLSDSHRELIDRLLEDTRPVTPLWSPATRLGLWVALAALVFLVTVWAGLRHDAGDRLRDPLFWLELVPLCTAAVALAAFALRAAVPGGEPAPREVVAAVALIAIAALCWLHLPVRADVPVATFVRAGVGCVIRSTLLAAVPWIALMIALRRGAPFAPATAGALAGAAAFLVAFAIMRLVCGLDEMLHILMWHGGPIIAGTALSMVAGTAWLSRWRRPPPP